MVRTDVLPRGVNGTGEHGVLGNNDLPCSTEYLP
jgi:hypothetical protein